MNNFFLDFASIIGGITDTISNHSSIRKLALVFLSLNY